jgi:hypothetical protein
MADPMRDYLEQREKVLETRVAELSDALSGVLGLITLVCARDDMPPAISDVLRTNHRAVDARALYDRLYPEFGLSQAAHDVLDKTNT